MTVVVRRALHRRSIIGASVTLIRRQLDTEWQPSAIVLKYLQYDCFCANQMGVWFGRLIRNWVSEVLPRCHLESMLTGQPIYDHLLRFRTGSWCPVRMRGMSDFMTRGA